MLVVGFRGSISYFSDQKMYSHVQFGEVITGTQMEYSKGNEILEKD